MAVSNKSATIILARECRCRPAQQHDWLDGPIGEETVLLRLGNRDTGVF